MRVGSFLVAESVGTDGRGRDVLSGVVESLAAWTSHHVSVYLEVFVAAGETRVAKFSIRLVHPDGQAVDFFRDLPVSLASEVPSLPVVLRGRLDVQQGGLYEMQLLVDGQIVADRPLLVA